MEKSSLPFHGKHPEVILDFFFPLSHPTSDPWEILLILPSEYILKTWSPLQLLAWSSHFYLSSRFCKTLLIIPASALSPSSPKVFSTKLPGYSFLEFQSDDAISQNASLTLWPYLLLSSVSPVQPLWPACCSIPGNTPGLLALLFPLTAVL